MSFNARVGGAWQAAQSLWVRVGGTWQQVQSAWVRVAGVWQQVFAALSVDVSAVVGQSNERFDPIESWAGIRFLNDGTWETMDNLATISSDWTPPENSGTWLTGGSAGEVWVEGVIGAGSFDNSAGAGRLNLATSRTWTIGTNGDPNDSPQIVTVTFNFYDAASGGNLLGSTSLLTYTALRSTM